MAPGEKIAVEVTYEPASTSEFTSAVKVCTDDPDNAEWVLPVSANIDGVGVGDPVPPFSLADLDGQVWTETSLEGKVGVLAYFATF